MQDLSHFISVVSEDGLEGKITYDREKTCFGVSVKASFKLVSSATEIG